MKKGYFRIKVKVTRSLTLVLFEREAVVDYASQIVSFYLLRFKSYSEVIVDNSKTDKQTHRQDKNNMTSIIRFEGIKSLQSFYSR